MSQVERIWIVSLQARSAAVIADDKILNILATPESTVPVAAVRIRNQRCLSDDDLTGPTFVGALVAEAAGEFADPEEAAALLANLASPYFQATALAANAAVDDPQDLFAFAPPRDAKDVGEYVVQRMCHPRSPAPVIRQLPAGLFMEMLEHLGKHLREDRLHRAMAHYRVALGHIEPRNWVLAAESLYLATENLGRVITQRLFVEAGLPATGEGKHHLAVLNGHAPKNEKDRSHLRRLDSWVREHHIFEDDRACYKQLLDASDAFEHGHLGFDVVQRLAEASARKAFGYIRRAVLREIGVPPSSGLFAEKFDIPLGGWRPILEVRGTYTDSGLKPGPGLAPESFQDEWPDFVGPDFMPRISRVVDNPDGTRSLSLTLEGHMNTLSATQMLKVEQTQWLLPDGKAESVPLVTDEMRVTLNGKDVTDDWQRGSAEAEAAAADLPEEPEPLTQ